MDSYSGLLSFIPDDDKYIKPFCGVLTMIVQVKIKSSYFSHAVVWTRIE